MSAKQPPKQKPEQATVAAERLAYRKPKLQDFGDARSLTQANTGTGSDGATSDAGLDTGLDAPGTAS